MNRILLTAFASVALSFATIPEAFGTPASQDEPKAHHGHEHGSSHHDNKMDAGKTADEMAKECEAHLEKIKDSGSSLPTDKKAEFEYSLEIAGVEAKALKDLNHKDPKKHAHSCQRHLKNAEQIVRKHENYLAHEKKMEERKAKVEERKEKALARKAEREAAKAKREAEKAERAAAHHDKTHEKESALDHGKSEGASKEVPGADAEKPITEEKK